VNQRGILVTSGKAFQPAELGKLKLKNRIMKAATFEGMTPNGVPGERLLNFHKGIVEGGVGLTTLSYCTTEADGRIMESMMWLHAGIEDELRNLISELKKSDAKVSGQVTHCGHFSQNKELQRNQPPKGPSKMFVGIGLTVGRPIAAPPHRHLSGCCKLYETRGFRCYGNSLWTWLWPVSIYQPQDE